MFQGGNDRRPERELENLVARSRSSLYLLVRRPHTQATHTPSHPLPYHSFPTTRTHARETNLSPTLPLFSRELLNGARRRRRTAAGGPRGDRRRQTKQTTRRRGGGGRAPSVSCARASLARRCARARLPGLRWSSRARLRPRPERAGAPPRVAHRSPGGRDNQVAPAPPLPTHTLVCVASVLPRLLSAPKKRVC